MNPYDFVRVDWSRTPQRKPFSPHNQFVADGLRGSLEGAITTLTPLFIPDKHVTASPQPFLRNTAQPRQAIIPGSSLKGLIRSLVETLAPGCWWLFDERYRRFDADRTRGLDYSSKLPQAFKKCSNMQSLCIACRLFGMLAGQQLLLGKVRFTDAVCVEEYPHDAVFTPALMEPKPRHQSWYLDSPNQARVTGRKFYFHQPGLQTQAQKTGYNQHIKPLGAGSRFEFRLAFENVAVDDEWPVLLYALTLEDEARVPAHPGDRAGAGHGPASRTVSVRHKLGYAKPAGLGSAHFEVTRLTLMPDAAARYGGEAREPRIIEGLALQAEIARVTAPYRTDTGSVTLNDLRRIWAWPPAPGITYRYPTQTEFADPTMTIATSP